MQKVELYRRWAGLLMSAYTVQIAKMNTLQTLPPSPQDLRCLGIRMVSVLCSQCI